MRRFLKGVGVGFAALVLLVFLFTRPESLGDLIGAAIGGVLKGADSIVIVIVEATS
ncbi:hypothetical protein AB0I81_22630 [Nonomuraea sp. NPDC050404]|uniref:hypothetical protein n=1 Tax=Nonomuraea sp. NPDC050404 TaxID=3155783 RepID=UPI0033E2B29A